MDYLDLFAGIGGFALGAYWAGMRFENHYFSEVDDYAIKVYRKRFSDAIPLGDIIKIDTGKLPQGEWIITGGYPCQPFSTASRGRKVTKDLWPEMLNIICKLKPRAVVGENVSRDSIINAARQMPNNYNCTIHRISAACLGATHHRIRWWMVAYSHGNSKSFGSIHEKVESIQSLSRHDKWLFPPGIVGMDDGVSSRMDRLKCLGNAIVPQIAEILFRRIKELCDCGKSKV